MEFCKEMDEVEEYLKTKIYPLHMQNDKGMKANFRRKCRSFAIQDNNLQYVHKPNRKKLNGVLFVYILGGNCVNNGNIREY